MPFLKLNGFELNVSSTAGATIERVKQGEYGRTALHQARSFVNATSDTRKGTTALYTNTDADLYQRVIRGEGHVWPFDSTTYSSKGLSPDSAPSVAFNPGVYGNALTVSGGGDPVVYLNPYSTWTVSGWVRDVGGTDTWTLYSLTSAGGFYVNGAATAFTSIPLESEDGEIRLQGSTDNALYDDLVLLPYVAPTTWPAWHFARGAALPQLPYVLAEGDWYGSATEVLGEVGNGRTEQWTAGGVLTTGEAFEFSLHRRLPY